MTSVVPDSSKADLRRKRDEAALKAQNPIKSLRVMKVNSEENLLLIKGAVPGPTGAVVLIKKKITD